MINSDNILAYIKYLYQKKYGQPSPAQLVSSWRKVEAYQIDAELQKLYQHWGWTHEESQQHETDFVTLAAILDENRQAETSVENTTTINEAPLPSIETKKKRSVWIWVLPILMLGLAYLVYDYVSQQQDDSETQTQNTEGTLLREPIVDESEEEIDTTEYLVEETDTLMVSDTTVLSMDDRQNILNVKSFIFAEDDRNIDKMFELVSPNIYKYYDLNYPTKAQLRTRYEHLWSITKNNTNYISDIKKVNERRYEVFGSYEYVGLNTQERKQQRTHLLFEMDENNRILSIDNAQ